jgi:hypothetical protein
MKNELTVLESGIEKELLESLLPFEGKKVFLKSISNRFKGRGQWSLIVEIEVNGIEKKMSSHSTDSLMIDFWNGTEGEEFPEFLGEDYVGKKTALSYVLNEYQDELYHFGDIRIVGYKSGREVGVIDADGKFNTNDKLDYSSSMFFDCKESAERFVENFDKSELHPDFKFEIEIED